MVQETRDVVQFVICATTTISLIALLLFHCIKSFKAFRATNSELEWNSVLFYSFLLIFIGLIYCSFAIFEEIYLSIHGYIDMAICSMLTTAFVSCYGTFKLIMYYALIARLTESFKNASTLYTCSNKFYLFWRIFLMITMIPFIIISRILIKIDNDQIKLGKCRVSIPIQNTIGIIIYDVFVCVINLYLFIIPLRKLSQTFDTKNTISSVYQMLIKKNAILASITILTTFFVWIIIGLLQYALNIPVVWQSIDCLISSLCIVLLFKWNQILFDILCCGGCCNNIDQEVIALEIATPTRSVSTSMQFSPKSKVDIEQ